MLKQTGTGAYGLHRPGLPQHVLNNRPRLSHRLPEAFGTRLKFLIKVYPQQVASPASPARSPEVGSLIRRRPGGCMSIGAALKGTLVVTRLDGASPDDQVIAALGAIGVTDVNLSGIGGVTVATWGFGAPYAAHDQPLLLSLTNWQRDGSVAPSRIARWIADGSLEHLAMLPPFAALGTTRNGGVRVVTDQMGFRQLYRLSDGRMSAVSTSARALSAMSGRGFDHDALALQSQLGWQLDQATLFRGVTKLLPGESLTVTAREITSDLIPEPSFQPLMLDEAVDRASGVLRQFMSSYLDENPDAVLQLTGGQDSRILLSAIPRSRRRGLRVMTVDAPGTRDAEVAGALSALFGMRHVVRSLDGLARLSPAACYELVCEAAARLDCMADPLARAATLWAERSLEQGPRLSGLGGEIARGFYYTGRVDRHRVPVTDERVERLAKWRMFANEPVEPAALADWLSKDAPRIALQSVDLAIRQSGMSWYEATDELYYRHRMQRWAGLGESAVCFDRALTNPMLDERFMAIARGLSPRDKQHSRFLALLQVALDDELASIPLDNRPPPRTYAEPGVVNAAKIRTAGLRAAARKVRQRLLRARRPPAGAAVVARLFSEHVQQHPELLVPVYESGVFSEAWLQGYSAGIVRATPSSLALLSNVMVAGAPRKEASAPSG